MIQIIRYLSSLAVLTLLAGCGASSSSHGSELSLGQRNNHALIGNSGVSLLSREERRQILHRKLAGNTAQPYHPVVYPAQLRLLWIPDRLNDKDYIPDNYYYLRITNDIFATEDLRDLETQLFEETDSKSNVPWIVKP